MNWSTPVLYCTEVQAVVVVMHLYAMGTKVRQTSSILTLVGEVIVTDIIPLVL